MEAIEMALLQALLIGFVALGLQATLVPHIAIAGIRPDLPLLAVVLLGYGRGAAGGTLAGFLIGLAQDLTNPSFLGLNALAKSVIGNGMGTMRAHLDAGSLPLRVAVLFAAVIAHDLIYLTIFTRLALSDLQLVL